MLCLREATLSWMAAGAFKLAARVNCIWQISLIAGL